MAERLCEVDTFSINVQRYLQNYAHNCISGLPYVHIGCNVSGLFESFDAKKLCSRVSSRECQFYLFIYYENRTKVHMKRLKNKTKTAN